MVPTKDKFLHYYVFFLHRKAKIVICNSKYERIDSFAAKSIKNFLKTVVKLDQVDNLIIFRQNC